MLTLRISISRMRPVCAHARRARIAIAAAAAAIDRRRRRRIMHACMHAMHARGIASSAYRYMHVYRV